MKPAWKNTSLCLYLLCASVYLLTRSASLLAIDGTRRFLLTESLLERGAVTPECPFPPAQSILQIPLYLVGAVLAAAGLLPEAVPVRQFAVGCFNALITPLSVLLLFHLGGRLGFRRRTRLGLALLFAFATMAFPYARFNSNEPLLSLLVLGLYWCVLRLREGATWRKTGGVGLFLAVLILDNYGMVPLVGATVTLLFLKRREMGLRPGFLLLLFLFIAVSVLFGLHYNCARYGSPWLSGYQRFSLFRNPGIGVFAFLFSPGRSVFLYNPVLVLSLACLPAFCRKEKSFWHRYFIFLVPGYFLILHASLRAWYGGTMWGPRYLVPVLPLLLLPLGEGLGRAGSLRFWPRALAAAVLAASALVQLFAVSVHYKQFWLNTSARPLIPSLRHLFSWGAGPFWGQAKMAGKSLVHPEYFDFFWIGQFSSHPAGVILSVGILLAGAIIAWRGLKRGMRADPVSSGGRS